ncbi:MAG: hypothetical protein ACOYS2_04110 [Patescibacteria group bacterium]
MDNQEMENKNQEGEMESQDSKWKNWIQENMRVLLSVIIVIAIAGGVYSYSKRSVPENLSDKVESDEIALIEENSPETAIVSEESESDETKEAEEMKKEEVKEDAPIAKETAKTEETQPEDRASSTATSQETEGSFIETAGKGDGLTHLGRRALANYLEKNPDSSLSAEHKIYIEDYLRKNVGYSKGIRTGASVEFSKKLIEEAIQKSKGLSDKQLNNLTQYSKKVPSLS